MIKVCGKEHNYKVWMGRNWERLEVNYENFLKFVREIANFWSLEWKLMHISSLNVIQFYLKIVMFKLL